MDPPTERTYMNFFEIELNKQSENNEKIDPWLHLWHFPDETKLTLTKRGRQLVFQKKQPPPDYFITRSLWSRYRADLHMSIPLSTIKRLLKNEYDLFITSFTVTSIGTQKMQLPIKLPLKVEESGLAELLAVLCHCKTVFNDGTYQTESLQKAEALVRSFKRVFYYELPMGQNSRGYYIRIPLPIIKAIVNLFTHSFNASIPKIIRSVKKCSEPDIIEFVSTWLKFGKIYRHDGTDKNYLYMFRVSDITRSLVELLEMITIQVENGSIEEKGQVIPVYIIPKTFHNQALLAIETPLTTKKNALLKEIAILRQQIKQKDARIQELENLIRSLEERSKNLWKEKESHRTAKYYYEQRLQLLNKQLEELKQQSIKTQEENRQLRRQLEKLIEFLEQTAEESSTENETKPILENKIPLIDEKDLTTLNYEEQYSIKRLTEEILTIKKENLWLKQQIKEFQIEMTRQQDQINEKISRFSTFEDILKQIIQNIPTLSKQLGNKTTTHQETPLNDSFRRENNTTIPKTPKIRVMDIPSFSTLLLSKISNWILILAHMNNGTISRKQLLQILQVNPQEYKNLDNEIRLLEQSRLIDINVTPDGEEIITLNYHKIASEFRTFEQIFKTKQIVREKQT